MGHGSAKDAYRSATKVVVVVADAVGVAAAAAAVAGTVVVVVVAAAAADVGMTAAEIAAGWTVGVVNMGARLETWDGDSGHPYVWEKAMGKERRGLCDGLGMDTRRKGRDGGGEIGV